MYGKDKDQMHPDDMRNLLLFFVAAALIYFAFDAFVLKPQRDAIAEANKVAAQEAAQNPQQAVQAKKELRPRFEVLADTTRVKIDNKEISGSISLKGGRIDDIALKSYYKTLDKLENVVLLSPRDTEFPRYVDYGWVAAEKGTAVPDADTLWRVQGNDRLQTGRPVTLVWDNGAGLTFERIFALDENYMFTVTQKVTNNSGKEITLYPYGLVTQTGIPPTLENIWIVHEGPMGWIGDELVEIKYKKIAKEKSKTFTAAEGWIGMADKYWLTGLIPPQGQNVNYRIHYGGGAQAKEWHTDKARYQADFTGSAVTLDNGQTTQSQSHVYTGAKKVLLLAEYKKQLDIPNFDLAVDFGWLWFMTKPFFFILHYLGEWVGNLGIAIIILTIMIRTAVFPLTNTSYKSFANMKKITPQIAELREAYGDDKTKLQQELVKLYEREGVNPMAGCFPILLQIPIFFALYKVLFVTIEVRHAPFFGWIQDLAARDPTSIFNLFGLIPWQPPDFLVVGVWPCLMLVAMIIQKKLNPPPQDPLQRDLANWFPFLITYILSRFSSGLVIYWTCSAFIGVIQQMIIMRSLDVPIHLFGETEDEKKLEKSVEEGPVVHPMAEMVEDEVEEALFGKDEEPSKDVTPPKPKKSKKKKK